LGKKGDGNKGLKKGIKFTQYKITHMRNRETINKKLETLDHVLINLQRIVNTNEPIQTYKKGIEKGQDIIEEIRSMIEREPRVNE